MGADITVTLEGLLATAQRREPMDKHADSLSGSSFERVVLDGERYVLKHVGQDTDWLARALGDEHCFVRTVWERGLLARLPAVIDHAIVAAGGDGVLMRDIGEFLAQDLSGHARYLDHMAAMHAAFWGFTDDEGLLPPGNRYTALTPAMAAREAAAGHDDPVPRAIPGGWRALRAADPVLHDAALALATDPAPLVAALDETPATFVHGDWKAGNLGGHPDGRTILLDWGWPGRAGPLVDLAWYLAVNCDLLPTSKEQAIADFRAALGRHGVDVTGWWDRQLNLALLGAFVQLGWSKAGDPAELDWWAGRVTGVAAELLR